MTEQIPNPNTGMSEEEQELLKAAAGISAEDRGEFLKAMTEHACASLKEKYGKDFGVFLTGDMIPTGVLKLYMYPEDEPTLAFTATAAMDGTIRDDYSLRRCLHSLECSLRTAFEEAGVACCANAVLPVSGLAEDRADTLEDYLRAYGQDRVLCRLIFPEDTDAKAVIPALEGACRALLFAVAVNGFILPEEGYVKCSDNFARYPSCTEALISRFAPLCTFSTVVRAGRSSLSADELAHRREG